VLLGGLFGGTVRFDGRENFTATSPTGHDIFLLEIDATDGRILWKTTIGTFSTFFVFLFLSSLFSGAREDFLYRYPVGITVGDDGNAYIAIVGSKRALTVPSSINFGIETLLPWDIVDSYVVRFKGIKAATPSPPVRGSSPTPKSTLFQSPIISLQPSHIPMSSLQSPVVSNASSHFDGSSNSTFLLSQNHATDTTFWVATLIVVNLLLIGAVIYGVRRCQRRQQQSIGHLPNYTIDKDI
jgi:preprotein translocase subunit SecG